MTSHRQVPRSGSRAAHHALRRLQLRDALGGVISPVRQLFLSGG